MIQIQTEKLTFTEYLKKLPPPWVIEHFLKEDTSSRKILSSALIEESVTDFIASGKLSARFKGLDEEQQQRCIGMYLMGALGISSDAESGLQDPLVAAFLGYATRDQKGTLRIFCFEQFTPALQPVLTEHLASTVEVEHPSPHHALPCRSSNDIAIVVALASQHQLTKKKNGRLCVSALQAIRKLTHTSDIARADDTELFACAITGYGISRKLLVETDQDYLLHATGFTQWLTLPELERQQDIVAYVSEKLCGWNTGLLAHFCTTFHPNWLSLSLFNDSDAADAREALLLLHFCEYIDLQKNGTETVFRIASRENYHPSRTDHAAVIMPDFSVIIPQEVPAELVFTFARFCSMQSLDKVYHCTVEKTILTEALSNGLEGIRILTVLEQWNAPSNVLETVREWIREFQRLSLTTGSILITSDERVTEQIAGCEQLKSCLERVEVHTMFRIKPGCERTVRDIVKKLGFDDRMPESHAVLYSPNEEDITFSPPVSPFVLITEDTPDAQKVTTSIRGTKYGAELKALELSELVQVIDYAILTGQRIVISYEGSPYVRKAIYTLTPSLCSKGVEPMLDGTLQNGVRKQFYVKKIGSIGVVPQ